MSESQRHELSLPLNILLCQECSAAVEQCAKSVEYWAIMTVMELLFSSCQAEIAEPFCIELAEFMGRSLGVPTDYVGDVPWEQRQNLLLQGEVHVGWICGLAYVREHARLPDTLDLVAAPVRRHPRYGGKPVYYSDLAVNAGSRYYTFEDLRGARCAFNEPGSHSGCNILRYHLAAKGMNGDYFRSVVESGSHRNSIRMLREGRIDVAAIDSSVLELETIQDPSIGRDLRVIASLGPSPAPPWIVHRSVPGEVRQALGRAFASMSGDAAGCEILRDAQMLGFARISDRDYDPIREMDRIASRISFG